MSGDRADEATQDLPEGTQVMPWEVKGTDEQGVASFFEALAEDLINGEDIPAEDDAEEEQEAGLEDDHAEESEEEDAGDIEDGDSEDEVEEEEELDLDDSEESDEDDPEETPEKQGLRLADYTRKTQELAQKSKELDQREVERENERQAFRRDYAERLEALDRAIGEMAGPEPDWDTLRRSNPAEFAAQWAEHQRMNDVRSKLQAEKDRELVQADNELFEREAKLLMSKLPEWSQEDVRVREQEAILDYAVNGLGFTEKEVQGVRDHRVFLMLRKAWLADKQASKADEVKEKIRSKRKPTRTLKPGARQPVQTKKAAKRSKDYAARQKALVESGGDEKLAASILETMLDDGII